MTAEEAYALAKSYVNKTLQGGGALKGKNVTISSIDPIDGGNRITFSYTLDNGNVETRELDVMDGKAGDDGFSPIITPNLQNDEETYRLDILDANGILTTINLMGKPGQQGIPGQQGRQGEQGIQGIQGIQGEQGDPFLIYKEYGALEEFQASDFYAVGQMFGVKPSGEGEMYNVYRYAGEGEPPYTFVTSLGTGESIKGEPGKPGEQGVPGEKGDDGTTYTPQIGTVTEGDYAAVGVDVDEGRKIATFNFMIPKGKDGKDGKDGKTYKPVVGTVDTGDEVEVRIDLDEDKQEAKFNFIFPIFGGINKTMFTFQIDQNESDPDSMITYLDDAKGMKPAHMDYALDKFNYGSWGDVWFIKDLKPCMLNYDGVVAYELNKDNYEYKLDGGLSDIKNVDFPGNAMSGIPKVYWKVMDNGDNKGNISVSDKKLDDDFHCWSHIDANGGEIDYCYMPIYNGSVHNNVLRSLSGKTPINNRIAQEEINYAVANNKNGENIWFTEVFSDRILITLLLLLISKSSNTVKVFGKGIRGKNSNAATNIKTGTMDQKGLFWGQKIDGNIGVKVFGIEHWWGYFNRRVAGIVAKDGKFKVKLTYGNSDGSGVDGYNIDGNEYIETSSALKENNWLSYISKMKFYKEGFFVPSECGGSSSMNYCNEMSNETSGTMYVNFGGGSYYDVNVGAFSIDAVRNNAYATAILGASLSCKPLAKTGG